MQSMEGVAADPAFLLFTACYIFLFHTEATMQSMEGVAAELAFLVLIVAWFFNEKWNALKDARMLFERNKRTLRNRISTARQLISSTPSGVCHVLEVDVAVAEVSCELSCLPQHQACITSSVVPSTLLKTSRARRRSCWRTAARSRSSATTRNTRGGFGG